MPRKLIYIPLKTLPQEATLHHIFETFAALRIAIKEEGLYVMFQDAAVSEQFKAHLKEGSYAEFENNCVEILGEEIDWQNSMEESLLQLTSQDLLNYTHFLSNRKKQMYSITSSPQQDSLHSSVKSEEGEKEIGLTLLSNIITLSQQNEGGNTFISGGDQIGLFEVPLCQETVCIQLEFEPESESKKSFLSSSEDQHKTSIICDDKLSEQKMTSNNQATKEELKPFENQVDEDGEEYMTEAITFEEEQIMRMNGEIGSSVNENGPQPEMEEFQSNEAPSQDKATDFEATADQNAEI